jgi:hypothetical protein
MQSVAALPESLGELIDAAYDAREALDDRKKELEADPKLIALTERFTKLEEAVLAKLVEQKSTLARGSTARAFTTPETRASVDIETGGWGAIWKWAVKNDALDIFYKRLASKAIVERLASMKKKVIPGVKVETTLRLNLRKVSGPSDE